MGDSGKTMGRANRRRPAATNRRIAGVTRKSCHRQSKRWRTRNLERTPPDRAACAAQPQCGDWFWGKLLAYGDWKWPRTASKAACEKETGAEETLRIPRSAGDSRAMKSWVCGTDPAAGRLFTDAGAAESAGRGPCGPPLVRLREMHAVFAESIRRPRLLAQLLFGLALILAGVGTSTVCFPTW